uniref:Uncharacterized protein n=1 Tax=Cacopsylla melanoneura TaxID=428564 RepID=A0A8D9AXC1_9HEMI
MGMTCINGCQSVQGRNEASFTLDRVWNNLFRVTHISSVNHIKYLVVSASDIRPHRYLTRISVGNSRNVALSNKNIHKIGLRSYGNSYRLQNVYIDFNFLLRPTPYPSLTTTTTASPSPTTTTPTHNYTYTYLPTSSTQITPTHNYTYTYLLTFSTQIVLL